MTSIPSRMMAIEIARPGGPEVLRLARRPVPELAPGEVLVRVSAAGVNRPDVMQREGKYPPPPGASEIPGLEIAGTVAALGASNAGLRWNVGDAVCALVSGGGYAEYAAVPAVQCLPIPAGTSIAAAAGMPETFFTVWTNLFQRGRLVAGEHALVHGGTSGIGTTAIQLAHAFGARVHTTAGSAEKCAACIALGASTAINYREDDFVEAVKRATAGRGVDVVLDIIGGEYLQRNLECLAMDGRLVQIGLMEGNRAELNLRPLLQKRLTITGSTLRARTVAEKGALALEVERHVWPLVASGRVTPVLHRTFPLTAADDAHRLLESSDHVGKIVLTVSDTV
jgi:putative PIG3 family NAD(P)H quinone oxidoreductase